MAQWERVLQSRPGFGATGLDEESVIDEADSGCATPCCSPATPLTTQSYRVSGVAPPAHGRGSVRNPSQLIGVSVASHQTAQDASGKAVVWFEVATVTAQYEWSVWKRFSECVQFDDAMRRVGIAKFRRMVQRPYPDFPSRFHIRSDKGTEFVERRRQRLDAYFRGICEFMREMHLLLVGVEGSDMAPPLTAAFQMLVDFLRGSSKSYGRMVSNHLVSLLPDRPVRSRGTGSPTVAGPKPSASPVGSPSRSRIIDTGATQRGDTPASKLILQRGVRFVIALFVPGVPVTDVYVELLDEEQHAVLVGGRWNSRAERLMASLHLPDDDAPTSPCDTAGTSSSVTSTGPPPPRALSRSQSPMAPVSVLMDTLPCGEFEIVFDIPHEFERTQWHGEHVDGVLFLIWDKPLPSPA